MFAKTVRRLAGEIIPLLTISVAALAALVIMRHVAMPQWHGLRALSGQAAQYRELSADKNRFVELKKTLIDKKEQLDRKYRSVAAMPDGSGQGLSGLLQLLIRRAKDADIQFVKMQPLNEGVTGKRDASIEAREYPVLLEMTTSYRSLGLFMSSLERASRLIRVDRLAITADKKGLDVRILVTCFIEKGE